jgi:hypothetical protein
VLVENNISILNGIMALHDNLLNQQGGGHNPGGAVDTVNNQALW